MKKGSNIFVVAGSKPLRAARASFITNPPPKKKIGYSGWLDPVFYKGGGGMKWDTQNWSKNANSDGTGITRVLIVG